MSNCGAYRPVIYKIDEQDLFVLIMRELIARVPNAVPTELRSKANEYMAELKKHKVIVEELVFGGSESAATQSSPRLTKEQFRRLGQLAQQTRDAERELEE